MAVASISMVRDEADIIEVCLRHMATQVDFLIVSDNGSTDGTRELLEELSKELPLSVFDDAETGYYQSRKMSALAAKAAGMGAEWVIPHDADEVWYSPFGRIGDELSHLRTEAIVPAALYDHVSTAADEQEPNPVKRLGWRRRKPVPLPKVACRVSQPVVIEQGNHGAHYDHTRIDLGLVIRHYPYRSSEQFERKVRNGAAAYAATDLPEDQGAHWRGYGRILEFQGSEALSKVFHEFFYGVDPESDPELIFDPCPELRS